MGSDLRYRVAGTGELIQAESCEVIVVAGCNLACRACKVLAPHASAVAARPEAVYEDMSLLVRHYRARRVELRGGEPLLNYALPEIAMAVRSTGVTDRIRVVTAGLHLHLMDVRFWDSVDEVLVSRFPDLPPREEDLTISVRRAQSHGVELRVRHFGSFRESFAEYGTPNGELIQRIYATCQYAHECQRHCVRDSFFSKCPQSHAIAESTAMNREGVRIHAGDSLGAELRAHLADPRPLAACQYCLGSVGKRFPHREITPRTWRSAHQTCTEHLLDWERLRQLESGDGPTPGGCLSTETVLVSGPGDRSA